MARTEDGEFELILGNRQLLSVFFIVVVLLGVFFTMGYIVGKNSTAPENYAKQRDPIVVDPTNPTPRDPSKTEATKPSALDPVPVTKPEVTEPKPLPAENAQKEAAQREAARKEELRRQEEARQEEARREEARREEARKKEAAAKEEKARKEAKKEEKKEPPRKEAAKPVSGTAPVLLADGSPAPGQQFLQVVASTRPDCEFIADVLKRKGLLATVVPGPDSKLFRVVVGPLSDAASISRVRSEIEKAGFQNPYLKRY